MSKSAIRAVAFALAASRLSVSEAQSIGLVGSSIVSQNASIPFSTVTSFVPVATICTSPTNSTGFNGTALNTTAITTTTSSDPTKSTATGASGCNTYFTQTELCSTTLTGMGQAPITITSCSQYVTFSTSTRTADSAATGPATRYSFLAPWQDVAAGGVPGAVEVMKCIGSNGTDYDDFEDQDEEGDEDGDCDVWSETWVLWEQYFESKSRTTVSLEQVVTGPAKISMPSLTTTITATTPTTIAIADVYTITKTIAVPSIQRIVATTASAAAVSPADPTATSGSSGVFVTTESTGNGTITVTFTVNTVGVTSTMTIHSTTTTYRTITSTIPASTPSLSSQSTNITASPQMPIPISSLPANTTASPLSINPGGPIITAASPSSSSSTASTTDQPLSFNPGGPLIPASSSFETVTTVSSSAETAVPSVNVQNVAAVATTTAAGVNGTVLDAGIMRERRYLRSGHEGGRRRWW